MKTLSRPPKWPLLTHMGQKMKIFNFELELNIDLHLDVKFDGKCDGDCPEAASGQAKLTNLIKIP